jgi:cytochrome c biogenesis protein CcdA
MAGFLAAGAAFFLWGLLRGLSTCLFLCAPGMVSIIVNEKAGMARSLWLGVLLSLPRILFLTALGAVLGFVGFEVVNAAPVRGALTAVSAGAYLFLGIMLLFVGARILDAYLQGTVDAGEKREGGRPGAKAVRSKKVKGKECDAPALGPSRLWSRIAMRFYPGKGRSEGLFLLWGGVLSLACLLELGLLEGAAASALAGTGAPAAAASAGGGAALMLVFSAGATVPVIAAAAAGGGLVSSVKSRATLEKIRGVGAMLMVLLGLYFVLAEIYKIAVMLNWY